jgi:carbonic anhydrase
MKVMKILCYILLIMLLIIQILSSSSTTTTAASSAAASTAAASSAAASSSSEHSSSSSGGSGPGSKTTPHTLDYTEKDWADTCKYGRRNSPIDVPDFTSEVFINSTDYIRIVSSNYSLISNTSWQVYHEYKFMMPIPEYVGDLYVFKNGTKYRYTLADIHLHVVSEHTIREEIFDLEVHMVHKKDTDWLIAQGVTDDPDKQQIYLVVGTLFKAKGNVPHPLIETFNFPTGIINNLDLNPYSDRNKNFFHYLGGLTTPPCVEVVNWVLMEKVEYMSIDQFKVLNEWVREFYPEFQGNGRIPRPLNGRSIYYADNFSNSQMNFSMIIVAMAAMFIVFFFRKKFDII